MSRDEVIDRTKVGHRFNNRDWTMYIYIYIYTVSSLKSLKVKIEKKKKKILTNTFSRELT